MKKDTNINANPPSSEAAGSEIPGFVGKARMLEILFPNKADRPSLRWLDMACQRREIPFIRLGRLIWFDPKQVRRVMVAHTIPNHLLTRRFALIIRYYHSFRAVSP